MEEIKIGDRVFKDNPENYMIIETEQDLNFAKLNGFVKIIEDEGAL